jgi:S1-C subfamily serine protease
LTSNGYIVTNYHVIEGSSIIKVKGVNGDFTNSYNARLVVSDKNNDLAIIQIDDTFFTNFNRIPYSINLNLSNVGENVFVLGYPLRSSMGDEIKLTNGIISSKTGYQGDITSYQISAPIQPGNSGGPLFDSKGNIIAIVNAKHSGAQNATLQLKHYT